MLALGGLISDEVDNMVTKVPILGDIPIIGWLFKNKNKTRIKSNLLVLITVRIIEPSNRRAFNEFTKDHVIEYNATVDEMEGPASNRRDPIHRWFFDERWGATEKAADKFMYKDEYANLEPHHLFEGPNTATIIGNPPVDAPMFSAIKKLLNQQSKPLSANPKPQENVNH